jgi:hypothetical protein
MLNHGDMEDVEMTEEAGTSAGDASRKLPPAEKDSSSRGRKHAWKRLISYRWIVRNVPFFLFLAVLAVVYIYNGHRADKTIRHMTTVNRELKELQYEYKTIKSEVMFRSKQSELARAVEPFGLKELVHPPVVLIDSSAR